jgi:hypothetical protein
MADTKYGKYIMYTQPGNKKVSLPDIIARTDGDMMPGSQHFLAHRISPWYVPRTHSPHFHKDPEMLVMMGLDPQNPWNLGAEVHLCMGPEMEKHIIKDSCLVFIPAKMIHCPISYHNVQRPFIFIQIQYSPKMTEFPCKNLLPEEEFAKMVSFNMDGTQKGISNPTWSSIELISG